MIILIIISIILDGIITYYIPSYFNRLNYFYPMLTVTLIPLLYTFYSKKKYYKTCFIIGFIYDLLYSNILLYNALIFLSLSKVNNKFYNYFKDNLFNKIVLVIVNIIIYDLISFILVYLTSYQSISIMTLLYKIEHSLLLNILAVFVYYFIGKNILTKHKV